MTQLKCNICHKFTQFNENETWECNHCGHKYELSKEGIFKCFDNESITDTLKWHDEAAKNIENPAHSIVGYRLSIHQKNILKTFLKINYGETSNILDVGCGNGNFASEVMKVLNVNKVFGVDFSMEQLKRINQKKVTSFHASAENLPFGDNQFSLVYCIEVIQNIKYINSTLTEIARVTKQDGLIAISSLYSGSLLRKLINILDPNNSEKDYCLRVKGEPDIYLRSPKDISDILEKTGLKYEGVYWIFSPLNYSKFSKSKSSIYFSLFAQNFLCLFRKA